MRSLLTTLLGTGLLIAAATPALADSVLFSHWDANLVCPHGWNTSVENNIVTMKPDDPEKYPGGPTILLFQSEYTFPWKLRPEDAIAACFEHLNTNYYVVRRGVAEPLVLEDAPNIEVLLIEGQVEIERDDDSIATEEVVIMRISRYEDDPGVFAMLLGDDTDAITWAAYVAGSTIAGLKYDDSLTEDQIRDFRLPETLD